MIIKATVMFSSLKKMERKKVSFRLNQFYFRDFLPLSNEIYGEVQVDYLRKNALNFLILYLILCQKTVKILTPWQYLLFSMGLGQHIVRLLLCWPKVQELNLQEKKN